jgi:uncharacterized protein YicC (UPF0701 family)
MAQSTHEDAVVSIDPSRAGGVADASRSPEIADASAVRSTTSLARCLPSLRRQIAVARTLLDELEESVPSSRALLATNAQVVEELKRLGTRVLDAAAVLAENQDAGREERLRG